MRNRPRIEAVDYLRGLFACAILVYHYTAAGFTPPPGIASLLAKLGLYGVAAFYVISGVSFGYVYRALPLTHDGLRSFYLKRGFRLLPLFWLAVAGTSVLTRTLPDAGTLALNLTLAFGVLAPAAYLPTGGWSIGNEVAFYLSFPFILLAMRRAGALGYVGVLAGSLALAGGFAFIALSPALPLATQWATYIHPANQWALFVAGIGVSLAIGRVTLSSRVSYAMLAGSVLVFVLLPGGTDATRMVTGWLRIAYVAACVAICAAGALGTFPLPKVLDRTFAFLGRTSYAIYLLHPIVLPVIVVLVPGTSRVVEIAVATGATLFASHLVYQWVEAPMIRVGKRMADGRRSADLPAEIAG